jgi:small subunit ribosomal protein S6e
VHGGVKKYIVLSAGPGFRATRHGERRRKLVRGRTITDETFQINFALSKEAAPEKKAPPPAKPAVPEKPLPSKQLEKSRPKKPVKKGAKK